MSANQNRLPDSIANCLKNGQNDPICVAVNIDITDIYDGALKVLKAIKPFWPINNVQFKVGSTNQQLVLCVRVKRKKNPTKQIHCVVFIFEFCCLFTKSVPFIKVTIHRNIKYTFISRVIFALF